MDALSQILTTLVATVRDVIPIVAIIFVFQLVVLRRPPPNLQRVLAGFVWVLLGLSLFLVGLEWALFPLGKPNSVPLFSSFGKHAESVLNHLDPQTITDLEFDLIRLILHDYCLAELS